MTAYNAALLTLLLGAAPTVSAAPTAAIAPGGTAPTASAAPTVTAAQGGRAPSAPARPVPAPPQDTGRAQARPAEVKDLPLIIAPAAGGVVGSVAGAPTGNVLAVLVTGDGGWASIDRGVAEVLTAGGVPVVGFNSLRYFWSRRTPEQTAADLERVLRYYVAATGRRELVLVGYSRGADVLPFIVSRLSPELRRQVSLVALLGPSRTVDFKFHVADWWSTTNHQTDQPVLPEVTKLLGGVRLLCAYGADDGDTICPSLPTESVEVVRLDGSHHFDGAYAELGRLVLRAAMPRAGA